MASPLDNNPFVDPVLAHYRAPDDNALDAYRTFFLAKITGRTDVSGVWNYDWLEQTFDTATGVAIDANPRREGGVVDGGPVSPALEVNNALVDAGTYVFMRAKGVVNGQIYYEFTYRPPAPDPGDYNPDVPVSGGPPCVTWYTEYLHLGGAAVYKGQVIRPGQLLGYLGPYSTGAHLHFSLGDGDQSQNPVAGSITAGVTTDIESWVSALGVPITGTHVGALPAPPANFTAPQLAVIRSHFALPINTAGALSWEGSVSSALHTGWDHWALDFAAPPTDVQGQPVYAAFSGADVRTTVVYSDYTPGVGHVVILRHRAGYCPDDGGGDEDATPIVVSGGLTLNRYLQAIVNLGPGLTVNVNNQLAVNIGFGLKVVDNKLVVDVDDLCACCGADPLTLDPSAEPTHGEYPLDVSFSVSVVGGVGPYDVLFEWDDFTPPDTFAGVDGPTQDAAHTFELPGAYQVVITVTDACGRSTSEIVQIVVSDPACDACLYCPSGHPPEYDFTLSGATGDFVGANGGWSLYHGNGCWWYGRLGDWFATLEVTGTVAFEITLTDGASELKWESDFQTSCCGTWDPGMMHFTGSTGEGDPPAFQTPGVSSVGDCVGCPVSCEQVASGHPTLYVHISGFAAPVTVPITFVGVDVSGHHWRNDLPITLECEGGRELIVNLYCLNGAWSIQLLCSGETSGDTSATFTYAPLLIDFGTFFASCFGFGPCHDVSVSVTVDANP